MLYERVFLSLSPHTCTLCPMFSLDPSVVGLAPPYTCWRQDIITRLCASHTCVTWLAKSLSFFPSCTWSFWSLVYKLFSTTDPRLPTTKFICSNSNFGAAALSAPMMLLCYSVASASFTSRYPWSLCVERLNSKNIFDLQSLIDCDHIRSPICILIYTYINIYIYIYTYIYICICIHIYI